MKSAQQAAHEVVGREFNLGSPKQLQEILFVERDLPKTKQIKSGYTTDADALQSLFAQTGDPVLEHLLRHRDVAKLKSTVDGLLKSVSDDGRIHTTFNQTVAATGRLSSTDPNLQNIPIRTEEGRRIRRAFVVGAGFEQLMTADYSQIEMRIMAHLSGDEALIEAFNSGVDFHAATASSVFHVPVEEVVPDQRRKIKAMNYGLAYGLSAFGLSNQLTISTDEARGLMEEYFERFGGVRDYLQAVVRRAVQDGYTATILGRRRYLPDLTSDNRQRREMAERMALNAPIQGSAADIIKVAMLQRRRGAARVRPALPDAAAGPRRAGLRRGAGGAGAAGGAGPPRDGRRLPAVGAAGGLGRRRPRLERRRPLTRDRPRATRDLARPRAWLDRVRSAFGVVRASDALSGTPGLRTARAARRPMSSRSMSMSSEDPPCAVSCESPVRRPAAVAARLDEHVLEAARGRASAGRTAPLDADQCEHLRADVQGARRPGAAAAAVDDRVGRRRRGLRLRPDRRVRPDRPDHLAPPQGAARGRPGRQRPPRHLGLLPRGPGRAELAR